MKHEDLRSVWERLWGFVQKAGHQRKVTKLWILFPWKAYSTREAVLGWGLPQKQGKLAHHRGSWPQEALRIIEGHWKQCDFTSCLQTPATKQDKSGASSCLSHFSAARCAKRKYSSSATGKPRNRNGWVKCTRGIGTDSLKRDGAGERHRR